MSPRRWSKPTSRRICGRAAAGGAGDGWRVPGGRGTASGQQQRGHEEQRAASRVASRGLGDGEASRRRRGQWRAADADRHPRLRGRRRGAGTAAACRATYSRIASSIGMRTVPAAGSTQRTTEHLLLLAPAASRGRRTACSAGERPAGWRVSCRDRAAAAAADRPIPRAGAGRRGARPTTAAATTLTSGKADGPAHDDAGGRRPRARSACPAPPRPSLSSCGSTRGHAPASASSCAHLGLAQRKERAGLELPREHAQPHAAEADRQREVQPVQSEARLRELGRARARRGRATRTTRIQSATMPTVFARRASGRARAAGGRAARSGRRRGRGHAAASRRGAAQVPGDLLGQVAGPDDQELREGEVGPQHHEGEHQLAEVVEVSASATTRRGPVAHDARDHHDAQGERGEGLARS